MNFKWDEIQRQPDGKVFLLYRHQRVIDEGLVHKGQDILDVGGWGMFATALIEDVGANCTILDLFTPDQYYPERVRALPHVEGDVLDQEHFSEGSFDLVTCFETLEHVRSVTISLINMHFWLRPGGWIAGTIPREGYCHLKDEPGIAFFNENELRQLLVHAGFDKITVEPSGSLAKDSTQSCIYFKARKPFPESPKQAIKPEPKKPGPKARGR